MKKMTRLRIAIAHDYLRTYGGGERVLEALHALWPDAVVYVASFDPVGMGRFAGIFRNYPLRTSWVQHIPLFRKKPFFYRWFLPLVWSSFNIRDIDIMISSSGSNIAKGVRVGRNVVHICYCHSPPRFLYGYETETRVPGWLMRLAAPLQMSLRLYDAATSRRVDYFVANSETVRNRIKRYYGRESVVIYPPVRVGADTGIHVKPAQYYLVVSRLVRHKHIDIIIKAANALRLPLVIVGTGKEERSLRSIAGNTVRFTGAVDDRELAVYYRQAKALLVSSGDEDFGITAIEAMSYGVPVIAFRSGGLEETVIEGKTGLFFDRLSPASLSDAIRTFERLRIDRRECINQARRFSEQRFKQQLTDLVLAAAARGRGGRLPTKIRRS